MNGKELNKYWVPKLASINSKINSTFQDYIKGFELTNTKDLLKESSTESLKDIAIKIFIESDGFDSAYNNGMHFLVQHAKFFNNNDLVILFDGILENKRYNITT